MKKLSFVTAIPLLLAAFTACSDQEVETGTGNTAATASFQPGQADLRIAVVGAGPSGLTAAYTLKQLGYTNVTVFEKEDHVGGKVLSFKAGPVAAELGAVYASPDYRTVLGLADELGVAYTANNLPRLVLDEQGRKLTFEQFLRSRYSQAEVVSALQHYAAALQEYAVIEQNGFANLPPELYTSFDEFSKAKGFAPVAQMAKSLFVGFGYGYYEDVPALYLMKLMGWLVKVGPNGLEAPPYFTFPDGYQSLWQKVAQQLNVRVSAKVTGIERGCEGEAATCDQPVALTINGTEHLTFDAVIISAPLKAVPSFMTLTEDERALFDKVQSSRYFATLFAAVHLAGEEVVFIHDHARPEKINHLSVWANPNKSLPVYIGYQLADRQSGLFKLTALMAWDILKLGGGVFGTIVKRQEWTDYFPRVTTEDLENGYFEQVEDLQGKQGVFYVGSSLSFETVEHTARYAKGLVLTHFPPAQ